jgi:putative ABC transport system permease protein
VLKFVVLVMKNLGRNKVRTSLTSAAVIVLVAIYAVVTTVTAKIAEMTDSQRDQSRLVVSDRWVTPSQVPLRYIPQIVDHPDVVDWTMWHFFPGFFDETRRQDRRGPGIGTQVKNIREMHAGLEKLDQAAIDALERNKTGALMGSAVMENMGWKIGDRFTFYNSIPPQRNLQFEIVGVLPPGTWSSSFFFRTDYYQEATGDDNATMIWLRLRDPSAATRVASDVQAKFRNQQPELKVETEGAGIARFATRNQSLVTIVQAVVMVLLIDMVIVLSNSISIATRERRVEMAVLKVLGLQPGHIMLMVIGEAMLVGALSGLAGTGLAVSLSELTLQGRLPATPATTFLLMFPIPASTLLWGVGLGTLVGLSGSVVPAWNARKVKVTEVFAKIA